MIDTPRTIRSGRRLLPVQKRLAVALSLAIACVEEANALVDPEPAPQAAFSSDFLHVAGPVDLSRFERGNVTLAGVYRPAIRVNDTPVPGMGEVTFRQVPGIESAQPCLDRGMLIRFGLDPDKLATQVASGNSVKPLTDEPFCGHIGDYLPGASIDFDDSEQILHVSIPQAFMASRARGYVSPDLWDDGETTAMLNYNVNTYHVRSGERRSTATFGGIRAGANLGGWRLRHTGNMSLRDGRHRWQNTQTYAQHDLTDARARLTVGDSYTSGEILDSVRLRGIAIASDQRMLPASQRGYAPTVRGIAQSNAQVAIRQNGYLIHSTTVAPGAFEIDDLYPTGYGSDLEVTVTEADGRTRTFVVPYTSVPQMLREGAYRFAVAAGQVVDNSVADTPFVFQATYQRGLTTNTTLYAGTTASNSYGSGLLGGAINLPFGAVSLDVTASRAAFRYGGVRRGVSTRLRYNRSVLSTGTNFGVAAYRFSTRDYLGVTDAARIRSYLKYGGLDPQAGGERGRFEATVAQTLGQGQLSLTGSISDYWGARGRDSAFSVAYGGGWRSMSYNVSVQRARLGNVLSAIPGRQSGEVDTTVYVSLSIPLGHAPGAPSLNTTHTQGSRAGSSTLASLNGYADRDGTLSYNVTASRSRQDGHGSNAGSGSLAYRAHAGSYRIGAATLSGGGQQYSVGAAGALVVHRDGLTLSQELGETNAIIHAPGAAGARVESTAGVRLDRHGNAVVRGLLPYQINTIAIDPRGASHDVELESTSESVAPRAGAFARLEYKTSQAQSLLIHATKPDGQALPFGASVYDAAGQAIGVVGQGSKIFTRGAKAGSRLTVSWGTSEVDRCEIDVPASIDSLGLHGMHRSFKAPCANDSMVSAPPIKAAIAA
ncbi:fimbrial biogenesis outer membrane usher protein [Luteibacter aegosomatis]|uniref:fimbria/pilus outer membrane usher protein n=1 Tax=Luteibacter aegosomatis TaxID=2911537 RepID=UPI001FF82372|nr:fimbria/pilus outer membrane usher protein [Luteibacter aegosomatis]UPG85908.1 fimbrial biogenesis outer membrane usher protein [Luteibacter aegosomatis]